jgi:beta-carotene hydroxylase
MSAQGQRRQAEPSPSKGTTAARPWNSKTLNALQSPTFAWPTALLGVVNLAVYLTVLTLVVNKALPLWAGIVINVLCAYVSYTPLHEAVHANVAGRQRDWINIAVGMTGAVPILHNVRLHRTTHLAHHAHLNDPERDADHWVAGQSKLAVLARCSSIIISHYVMGIGKARTSAGGRRKLLLGMIENTITLVPFAIVTATASLWVALALVLLPALIGQTILGYLFDYAVHAPYETNDTVKGTRAFIAPGVLNRVLTFAYLAQNYHVMHHLRTSIPFYAYRRAFDLVEPELIAAGSPIVRW